MEVKINPYTERAVVRAHITIKHVSISMSQPIIHAIGKTSDKREISEHIS